jgi:adenosine deaminase
MSEKPRPSYDQVYNLDDNEQLQHLFTTKGRLARKTVPTLGRLTQEAEVGQVLTTYVGKTAAELEVLQADGYSDEVIKLDDGSFAVIEDQPTITHGVVVSRNVQPVGYVDGKPLYNEWTQPVTQWMDSYQARPTQEFAEYQKKKTIMVLEIDNEVMAAICGDPSANSTKIHVDKVARGDRGKSQEIYKGGYLFSNGYGITAQEFAKTYEWVEGLDHAEKIGIYQRQIEKMQIADLHIHPTGSMSPLHALILGERHFDVLQGFVKEGIAPPLMAQFLEAVKSRDLGQITELLASPNQDELSLGEYFSRYSVLSWLLQSSREVVETAYSVGRQSANSGVKHIELRLSPITPGVEDEAQFRDEVIKNLWHNYWGLSLAREENPGFSFSLISILPKTADPALMKVVVNEVSKFCRLDEGQIAERLMAVGVEREDARQHAVSFQASITGFDTAGPEVGFEFTDEWQNVFADIRNGQQEGLWNKITSHAGESWQSMEDGLQRMKDAVANGCKRIGHGLAAGLNPEMWLDKLDDTKSIDISTLFSIIQQEEGDLNKILSLTNDIGLPLLRQSDQVSNHYRFSDRIWNKDYLVKLIKDEDPDTIKTLLALWDQAKGQPYTADRLRKITTQQEELMSLLKARGVTIEINLSSNIGTGNVAEDKDHPFYRLRENGVKVVIGTDALMISNTTVPIELAKLGVAGDIPLNEIEKLMLEVANRQGFQSLEDLPDNIKKYMLADETQQTKVLLKAVRAVQASEFRSFTASGLSAQEVDSFAVLMAQPATIMDSDVGRKITQVKENLDRLLVNLQVGDIEVINQVVSQLANGDKFLIKLGLSLKLYLDGDLPLADALESAFVKEQIEMLFDQTSVDQDKISWWQHTLGQSSQALLSESMNEAFSGERDWGELTPAQEANLNLIRGYNEDEDESNNKLISTDKLRTELRKSQSRVLSFTGFSKQSYHESQVGMFKNYLRNLFTNLSKNTHILVGGNDMGVDQMVAEIALECGLPIISVVPKAGLEYSLITDSKYFVVEGETWPDDNKGFSDFSDMMIVVGGGKTVRSRIDWATKYRIPTFALEGFPGASDEVGGKYDIFSEDGLRSLVMQQLLMVDPDRKDLDEIKISVDSELPRLEEIADSAVLSEVDNLSSAQQKIAQWQEQGRKVINLSGDVGSSADYFKIESQLGTLFDSYLGVDNLAFSINVDEMGYAWADCVSKVFKDKGVEFQLIEASAGKNLATHYDAVVLVNADIDNKVQVELTCEAVKHDKLLLTMIAGSLAEQLGLPGSNCVSAFDLARELVKRFGSEVLDPDYKEEVAVYDLRRFA